MSLEKPLNAFQNFQFEGALGKHLQKSLIGILFRKNNCKFKENQLQEIDAYSKRATVYCSVKCTKTLLRYQILNNTARD